MHCDESLYISNGSNHDFSGLNDLASLTELIIVFDDGNVTAKVGTLYVDNIAFE
ncbi:hypothetical protein ACFLQ1_02020 [Candidatus Auribacterota bacterium]